METQCSEEVRDSGRWPSYHRCPKKAVVERDGKAYCKIHDPEYIKAKNAALQDRLKAEGDALSKKWRREFAERTACDSIPTEVLESGLILKLYDAHLKAQS